MGAYLSEPQTEKFSSDEINEWLRCGSSSMQGWRVSQEDAHNCALDFDTSTAFFAVYDGHGGSEVAAYCAQKLPEFLRATEAYKRGDYDQALKDTFLGFDETLTREDVIEELRKLMPEKAGLFGNPLHCDSEESSEDLDELCEEGSMPLNQVLEKYKQHPLLKKLKDAGGSHSQKPNSPFLRGKKTGHALSETDAGAGPSSSSSSNVTNDVGSSQGGGAVDSEESKVSSSSAKQQNCVGEGGSEATSATSETNGPSSSSVAIEATKSTDGIDGAVSSSAQQKDAAPSSSSSALNGECKINVDNCGISSSSSGPAAGTTAGAAGSSISDENGKISSTRKEEKKTRRRGAPPTNSLDDTDSSSDEEDGEFNVSDENSSTEEEVEFMGGDDDDDEDEEEEDDDDDDDENEDGEEGEAYNQEDEDDDFINSMEESPGNSSGCTAVAALLRGKDLFVANAGDSRCVVCRAGTALEMSLDHKPEDAVELQRIVNAGGRVTLDGRVNGGLNLSRAIGDHAYKLNTELKPEEQMISALPDIKHITIGEEDEFIVLACDGIWNFMTSADVIKFVKARIDAGDKKLSEICEELFDYCLAPSTAGDGTGCDNMTAVIVQFVKKDAKTKTESATAAISGVKCPVTNANGAAPSESLNKKRPNDDTASDDNKEADAADSGSECKRLKTDTAENDDEATPSVETTTTT